MKIETDDFLFITNANIISSGWEETSPGVFKLRGRTTNEKE